MKNKPSYLSVIFSILRKDLLSEWRSREMLAGMLVFALLVIFIFNFALELEANLRAELSAGILWVTLIFAGVLGLNRSLAAEKERGCLDGLLLAPIDRTALFFGKAAANYLFMLLTALIIVPLFSLFYNQNLFQPGLWLVILLGCLGYCLSGTLLSAMAVQARTRDILLPVLLFPITIPVLVAAVKASSIFLQAAVWSEALPWLNLLLVYDVIFSAAGLMLFDFVIEE